MTKLESRDVLRSAGGTSTPIALASDGPDHLLVSLRMSSEAIGALDRLARATGNSLEDVFAKAFILYKAAAEANRDGKAVGIAPTSDVLETEFVGF